MSEVETKANRVLNIILFAFLLIGLRVWQLAVIRHDEYVEIARKPQQKTILETPNRGTIRDRFNIPLAVNKIQYNAALVYEPIRRLPRAKIVRGESGKKERISPRKEYIERFSRYIADVLGLDAQMIEDLLYSKASIFPSMPFILQEDIPEEIYYRLKIAEKDWPGLLMQKAARRYYPQGMLASSVIGYMGAISEREHALLQEEILTLEKYMHERSLGLPVVLPKGYTSSLEIKQKLQELKDKAYTINSTVGKAGIEGKFDRDLRGIVGKKKIEIDKYGNPKRELPESYEATPGRRILLTISAELQEYAEKLLAESEIIRIERFPTAGKDHDKITPPWIKGGAIVAMLPKTGEIVAMASFPRFDPNDFATCSKRKKSAKWLEIPSYIGQIWDGFLPLEREFVGLKVPEKIETQKYLTLETYLDAILSLGSSVRKSIDRIGNLQNAIYLLNAVETIFALSEEATIHPVIDALYPKDETTFYQTTKEKREEILERIGEKTTLLEEIMREINPYLARIRKNDDKILLLDILRTICPNHLFDDTLLTATGEESLSAYRLFNQATLAVEKEITPLLREEFHKIDFPKWRKTYFADYLKEKRKEEKEGKKSQKAYLDYLVEMEECLFQNFFEANRFDFITSYLIEDAPIACEDPRMPYFEAIIAKGVEEKSPSYELLKRHLLQMELPMAKAYLKTMRSFKELNRPLWGKYYFPFGGGKSATEQHLARAFYPAPGFGYAKSFAFQETAPLGSIFKFITAYAAAREHYKKNHDHLHFDVSPLTLVDQSPPRSEKLTKSSVFGYTDSGKPITRFYKGGRLPRGHTNIGRVDLKKALETSSNLFFSILSADILEKPSDLEKTAYELGFGKETGVLLPREVKGIVPGDVMGDQSALYALAIGQHSLTVSPLQTARALASFVNGGELLRPQIVKTIANLEKAEGVEALFSAKDYTYKEYLENIGIYFPLFTEAQEKMQVPYVWQSKKEVQKKIFLPEEVKRELLEGLYDVVNGPKGTARYGVIRSLWEKPRWRKNYQEIKPYLAGKTSTAEVAFRPCQDREFAPIISTHVWFGGFSFMEKSVHTEPDLVVVVYLRYGDHGKEAAPLAAEIVKKWREIQKSHEE